MGDLQDLGVTTESGIVRLTPTATAARVALAGPDDLVGSAIASSASQQERRSLARVFDIA